MSIFKSFCFRGTLYFIIIVETYTRKEETKTITISKQKTPCEFFSVVECAQPTYLYQNINTCGENKPNTDMFTKEKRRNKPM